MAFLVKVFDTQQRCYMDKPFIGGMLPIAVITEWTDDNEDAPPPEGWLFCDNSAYSKEEYDKLYDVIGDTYTLPDTEDGYFNVPLVEGSIICYDNNIQPKIPYYPEYLEMPDGHKITFGEEGGFMGFYKDDDPEFHSFSGHRNIPHADATHDDVLVPEDFSSDEGINLVGQLGCGTSQDDVLVGYNCIDHTYEEPTNPDGFTYAGTMQIDGTATENKVLEGYTFRTDPWTTRVGRLKLTGSDIPEYAVVKGKTYLDSEGNQHTGTLVMSTTRAISDANNNQIISWYICCPTVMSVGNSTYTSDVDVRKNLTDLASFTVQLAPGETGPVKYRYKRVGESWNEGVVCSTSSNETVTFTKDPSSWVNFRGMAMMIEINYEKPYKKIALSCKGGRQTWGDPIWTGGPWGEFYAGPYLGNNNTTTSAPDWWLDENFHYPETE